ncbi:NVEALA domain-containing protein [uncultured Bacteroides sp.]|nr:NVEALA domain-containing protein [uncultured Bacteroides sp.]
MKTKLIIACFLLITTAFIYIYSDSEKAGLSTLALANIEALAD